MEKHLPYNIEAEAGILGSILIDPEAMAQVADRLKPSDFYRDAHAEIFRAMLTLYERREYCDLITLYDVLERTGKAKEVGGMSYLASLPSDLPTSQNATAYATIVERAAECRRLIHAASQIAAIGYEEDPEAVQKAEKIIFSLGASRSHAGFLSMQTLIDEYSEHVDALYENRGTFSGVPTGLSDLDKATAGLQRQDLIILAGRPGSGKTSLGLTIGYNAAQAGYGVAFFSLEMGRRQLAMRLVGMDSGTNTRRLQDGWIPAHQWERIVDSMGKLAHLPIWVNDAPGNPIASMRSQLYRLKQEAQLDLIVVDYLQLIEPDHERRNDTRVNEVGRLSAGMKSLAKEFDVPVLALAQLSRKVEERSSKIPMLSDLRESGSIENDADIVAFIYRDDYYAKQEQRQSNRPGIADIIIAKYRNGDPGAIALRYIAEQTKFENLDGTDVPSTGDTHE